MPIELKRQFDKCQISLIIYQDRSPEEISRLVNIYNNHNGMNVSQKSLTYIGKYANEIRRIKDTNRFLMDGTALTENEKHKGVWERVISECVMAVYHFDAWKKDPKKICDYLNENSSEMEFKNMEALFNRMAAFSDKLENKAVSDLFLSKNLAVWTMVFDKFTNYGKDDSDFGKFLIALSTDLRNVKINEISWDDLESGRSTKDKNVILQKYDHLMALLVDFLKIGKNEGTENADKCGCIVIVNGRDNDRGGKKPIEL